MPPVAKMGNPHSPATAQVQSQRWLAAKGFALPSSASIARVSVNSAGSRGEEP